MTWSRPYALAPLQHIQTTWRPPWLIAQSALHGERHYRAGEVTEDSHLVGGCKSVTWLIVADGVGSADYASEGSRLVCNAVERYLGEAITGGRACSRALLEDAYAHANAAVTTHARQLRLHPDDLACTLAVALLDGDAIYGASIGDSVVATVSMVTGFNASKRRVFTPFCTAAQLPGTATHAITGPGWRKYIATNETRHPSVKIVFVASDGGQDFFLRPFGRDEHLWDPEWLDYFESVYAVVGPRLVGNALAQFIEQDKPEHKDDRTLIIAYRPERDVAPPAFTGNIPSR